MPNKLKHLIIDVDGVLSAGKQYIDCRGDKLFKAFHTRDIRAIREFVQFGVEVYVMSADDWPGTPLWVEARGAEFICTRDKVETAEKLGLDPKKTLAVGDDAWDVPIMRWANWAACPADADPCVERKVPCVMIMHDVNGGDGVIARLLTELIDTGLPHGGVHNDG
jgi:3-deoxy-D-manno-octulosonate 8-phosphate phosphatase KdsC-like HAD superfamily phosphatase